ANAYSLCSSRSFLMKVGAMINSNMSRLNVSSDTGDRAPSAVNILPFQNCFKLAQSVSQGGAIVVSQYFGYASAGEGNPAILRYKANASGPSRQSAAGQARQRRNLCWRHAIIAIGAITRTPAALVNPARSPSAPACNHRSRLAA